MPAWLQLSLRKWLSSGAKVTFWRPFCLCKLDGQEPKIPLGNRVYRIQHTQNRLKSLVPNFYSKMLLTFTYFRNLTSLKDFLENIDEYAIENLSTELDRLEGQDINQETIDNMTSLIKDIYLDAAKKVVF